MVFSNKTWHTGLAFHACTFPEFWITWIIFLHQRLCALHIWPTRKCIDENMPLCFKQNLYACRTSDKKITKDCGILDLLEAGDQVMADCGIDIEEDLPPNVTLNILPFLNGKYQFSLEEEVGTRKIASVRVHVERTIARIKNFRILYQVVPITIAKDLDKIWTVCYYYYY